MIVDAIRALAAGKDLSESQSGALLSAIMEGQATDAQTGAVLALLKQKSETPGEVTGFVRTMRAKALSIPYEGPVMDLCGTGGDGIGTINISTAVSFVIAACGITVAKHGNRAATSKSGGADVLEALGLALDASPDQMARALSEVGIAFLFARTLHPAMRHVAGARKELGIRTVFNILGPLTNPLSPAWQLLGVFSPTVAPLMGNVLKHIGCERVWLVHGHGGLDEFSPSGPTHVWEVASQVDGIREFDLSPQDFGLPERPLEAIKGGTPEENARILQAVFRGEESPALEAVLMNAAAALMVAGKAEDPKAGVAMARDAIDSGRAAGKLAALVDLMKG